MNLPNRLKKYTALFSLLATSSAISAAELQVNIRNLLPGQGEVFVVLFNSATGFPTTPPSNAPLQRTKPQTDSVTVHFKDLPEGAWAVAVLQDLNGNASQDFTTFGFPKEPYGVSNNKVPKFSAPSYSEAVITLGATPTIITIVAKRPD